MANLSMAGYASAPDRAPTAIRVGEIFSRSAKLFAAHWAAYGIVELFGYAPFVAVRYFLTIVDAASTPPSELSDALIALASLVGSVGLILAHATIYFGAAREAGGLPFSLGQSLGAALRKSPALIGAALLVGIFSVLAAFLLIIPGVIVFCVYAVALPCCVVEGLGPIKSMSRSAFLSKGNRWRIFGIFLVFHVGLGFLNELIAVLSQAFAGPLWSAGASMLLGGLIGAFGAVLMGVLYTRLRVAREGVDSDQIARIFD
jgi:hypothetical protein